MTDPVGANSWERMNNAIVAMVQAAYAAQSDGDIPTGRVRAIEALSDHWAAFWRSSLRGTVQGREKLARYVEWYTRAWALLPPSARAQCPRPDALDPSLADIAREALREYMTGLESTGQAGRYVADKAAQLAGEIKASVATGLGNLLAIAGLGLIAYLIARGDR